MHQTEHRGLTLYDRRGSRKYVTRSERCRFLSAAFEREDVAGTLALTVALTGCRLSEALALTAASINREECFIAFRCLKKRGAVVMREVPIPRHLVERLVAVHDFADQAARLWPFGRTWGWTLIKRVMHEADLGTGPHACPRGLRHGLGIHAVSSGVPVTFVKRWLGHSRLSTTEIYLDAVGPEEREIAARMWP